MYPRHALFSEDRRAFDESRFWFQERLHWPEPLYPFDALVVESLFVGLGQAQRAAVRRPSRRSGRSTGCSAATSIRARTRSPTRALLARRAELFEARAGYYYRHWDELYDRWVRKVEDATARAPGARGAGAPGRRGRVDRHGGPGLRLEPPATRRLRPPARGRRPRPPLPLRAAQPRLRRRTSSSTSSAAAPSRTSRTRRSRGWCRGSTLLVAAPGRGARAPRRARARARRRPRR